MQEQIRNLLISLAHLGPEMVLGVTACVLFLGGTFRPNRTLWNVVALGGLVFAGVALVFCAGFPRPEGEEALYTASVLFDPLAMLVRGTALAAGLIFLLFGWNEVPERHIPEHHGCLLVIVAGFSLTGAAHDLVTLFLSLELISIPTYILLYLPRHDDPAQEAALKYFFLSVFSSALLLFGFSYLYGLTGTTNLAAIQHTLYQTPSREMPVVAHLALITIVAGLGFKITAVPFHFYAPDVYQGAPTIGAALLAFIPKAAGFIALLRLLGFVLPFAVSEARHGIILSDQVPILFWFLAAVTMTLGNVLALLQDNLKRLLAYSSVAHAGYMLMALASAPYLRQTGRGEPDGVVALLFYLLAYGAMTIGAFAVISYLSTPSGEKGSEGKPVETVDDLAGLSTSHPGVALLMAVFLFSLIGIPLTAGFTGKFLIFFGAMAVPVTRTTLFTILAVVGMLNAAIGGWYYVRIVAAMYLRTPLQPLPKPRNWPGLAAIVICALLTIGLSIPPAANWLLQAARAARGADIQFPAQEAGEKQ